MFDSIPYSQKRPFYQCLHFPASEPVCHPSVCPIFREPNISRKALREFFGFGSNWLVKGQSCESCNTFLSYVCNFTEVIQPGLLCFQIKPGSLKGQRCHSPFARTSLWFQTERSAAYWDSGRGGLCSNTSAVCEIACRFMAECSPEESFEYRAFLWSRAWRRLTETHWKDFNTTQMRRVEKRYSLEIDQCDNTKNWV